jgi:hypothetical protein
MAKVAKYPPLFFHLMDPDTLSSRIGLYAPVFWVVLTDKIGYAIETHKLWC